VSRKENWGLPDWRNANAYPHPAKTSRNAWAWEFLRRNPIYRKWWIDRYEPLTKLIVRPRLVPETNRKSNHKNFIIRLDQKKQKLLTIPAKIVGYNPSVRAFKEIKGDELKVYNEVKKRFGVTIPEDPRKNFPPASFEKSFIYCIPGPRSISDWEIEAHQMLVIFDLTGSIQSQTRKAREILKDYARKSKFLRSPHRHQLKHLPIYLRVLDAIDFGTSREERAAVFFPKKDNSKPTYKGNEAVRDLERAAIALREEGYRSLVIY